MPILVLGTPSLTDPTHRSQKRLPFVPHDLHPATFHGNRVDQQFIAGQWRDGATGDRASDINPYTDDVVAEFALATAEDLDEAYRAAAEAQKAWAATGPGERSAVLRRAAAIMEECREEIADWLVKESGSTRIKAAAEIGSAIAITAMLIVTLLALVFLFLNRRFLKVRA